MYFNPNSVLQIQIRDRLRDLMEADSDVRRAYPAPLAIRSLPVDDVSQDVIYSAAITIADEDFNLDIEGQYGTYTSAPWLVLSLKRFCDGTNDVESSYDDCVRVMSILRLALTKYQSDPTPGMPTRLWTEMRFRPSLATRNVRPTGKFWASDTIFQLKSYQRIPQP